MPKQKRFLVFESYPYFSGSQRISFNFCKILHQQGYHITLLLADDSFGTLKKNFGPYVHEIKYVHTPARLKNYGNSESWFSSGNFFKSFFLGLLPFYIKCFLVLLKGKYDFYYYCDPRGATMLLPVIFLFRGKKIWHFHGRNKLPDPISKFFIQWADSIVCVSNDVAVSLPATVKKTTIYNGIDFKQYENISLEAAETDLQAELGNNYANSTKLLYGGLIRPHKGIHHLINAFSAILESSSDKNMHLFLLGEPKTEWEQRYLEEMKLRCINLGIDKNVHWMGWKSNLLAWMKCCDFFVFPSIDQEENKFEGFGETIVTTEGLPTVLIEASLSGIFSIASSVTGVKEIITEGHNGSIYNPNEEGALLETLHKAILGKREFKDFPNYSNFLLSTFENRMLDLLK